MNPDDFDTDAERLTAEAGQRCETLLRQMRNRYPTALATMNLFAARKGDPQLGDWPQWCWVPMAAAAAAVTNGDPGMLPPVPADIARVMALSTWRLTKGVYWIDEDRVLAPALANIRDAHAAVPNWPIRAEQILTRMPQHCLYLALPRPTTPHPPPGLLPAGLFIHLEHDVNTGRWADANRHPHRQLLRRQPSCGRSWRAWRPGPTRTASTCCWLSPAGPRTG